MKTKIFIAALVITILAGASCKKFLQIEPQFEFTSAAATASLDGLNKITTGMFNQLQSANLYGGGIIANSELLADFTTTDPGLINDYNLDQLISRSMNSQNGTSGGMWDDAYKAVYMANTIFAYLPKYASQNPSLAQRIKGDAYFVRGAMFFELVRMFAQPSGFTSDDSHLGIPIVLTATTSLTEGQTTPRSTVAQVYAQIESDLDSAIANLPAGSPNAQAPGCSQISAQGILLRALFTQHKYQQALALSNQLANTGLLALDSLGSIYNMTGLTQNSEVVFQQIATLTGILDVSNGPLTGRFRLANPLTPVDCRLSDTCLLYLSEDTAANSSRWRALYRKGTYGGKVVYYTRKYDNIYMSVTVMRYAEVLLTRAECNLQTGGSTTQVLSDLNAIRTRAGLLPESTTNTLALIHAVRAERDAELAFEGDRFYEIKRRGADPQYPVLGFRAPESGQFYYWNSSVLVYPIPLQEVQRNKNMVQNPGY